MGQVHAFGDDALGCDDAVGLTERLRRGEVSPAELAEAAIARLELVAPALNALAVTDYDRARGMAEVTRPSDLRRLAGLPTVLKDNVDREGLPTQNGTDSFVARPARRDGDVARAFLELGLVPLAKTRMSEFGFSAAAEHPRLGPVVTPWDTGRVAGASSAGSGALVAAGAVPLAHGNDGGGSIRIPASVNGLVGLKPTRGRVPSDVVNRHMPLRIVADGVLTRSVRDTAAFLAELELVQPPARGLPPVGDVRRPDGRRLRIGFTTHGADRTASPEVDALTRRTALLLEGLGHSVEEVEAPLTEQLAEDFLLYWGFLALMILRGGRILGSSWDPTRTDNLTRGLADRARQRVAQLPGAVRRLRTAAAISTEFHATYDVVLTPTLGHETPPVGHLDPTQDFEVLLERLRDWVIFTPWHNVSGAPAVSLPVATTASGLPQGMLFAAAPGREATLLTLAYELEEARPFARVGPDFASGAMPL
jgi:amidase